MKQTNELRKTAFGWWAEAGTLPQVAVCLVIVATSWFLLKELAVLLRPLLLAALLCYVIVPIHKRLHQSRSQTATIFMMTGGTLLIAVVLSLLVYGSVIEFNEDLPRLKVRSQELAQKAQDWSNENLPPWLSRAVDDAARVETKGAQQLPDVGKAFLAYAADFFIEMPVVALYVIFLLIEAKRLHRRVQGGFDSQQANQILATVQTINLGIANFLRAKVKSSLILAMPVAAILFLFGVKSAAIWGLLTFLCNFIPYVGSVVGAGSPIIYSFLDLPLGWQPFAVAALIVSCHVASASFVEPTLLGNAVGLSPLVILISLTFWGLCWGIVGMLLAVPLTVALKIVLANIDATRPIATLLGDT